MWESIREPLSANRRIVRNDYPQVKDTNKHLNAEHKFLLSYFDLFLRISLLVLHFFFFIYLSLPCRVTHASFTYFSFSFTYIFILCFILFRLFSFDSYLPIYSIELYLRQILRIWKQFCKHGDYLNVGKINLYYYFKDIRDKIILCNIPLSSSNVNKFSHRFKK